MKNRIALAAAGLLALALAPNAAHAAACANGATNGYTTKLADGTIQCVAAIVLGDGRIVQFTSPVDQTGAAIAPATAGAQTTGNNTLASILSAQATGAKQDTGNTSLASILSAVQSGNTAQATAANQALLNAANGTPADPAYNGSNTASEIALLKAIFGQAPAAGTAGAAPTNGSAIAYFQGVKGATPAPVDIVIQATATPRSTILPVQESAATVAAGGASNAVGDVLTFVGGSSTVPVSGTQASPGKCTVTAVSSGAVTTCVPLAGSLGSYTSLPSNPVATTSSGSGTGATINVTYAGLAVQIAPANTGRRGLHLQPQGTLAYLRGAGVSATADYNSMQIPTGALYETSPAFVGTGALSMITSGTTPLGLYAAEF